MRKRILFVDDDPIASEPLCAALRDEGFLVDYASTVQLALSTIRQTDYDLAIVDVMMPTGGLGFIETRGGFETGIALARRLQRASATVRVLGITQRDTPETAEWFSARGCGLCSKSDALLNPSVLTRQVQQVLQSGPEKRLRAFIVHGHDLQLRDELKEMLETEFGLTVVVLDEQPWRSRTLLEKFEEEASNVDVVFVLLTPDDFVGDDSGQRQARPNVLVELGYFLGRLGRRRGKIVLLYKEQTAMPSDLHGLGHVDVTHGLSAAREAIRRELDVIANRSRS